MKCASTYTGAPTIEQRRSTCQHLLRGPPGKRQQHDLLWRHTVANQPGYSVYKCSRLPRSCPGYNKDGTSPPGGRFVLPLIEFAPEIQPVRIADGKLFGGDDDTTSHGATYTLAFDTIPKDPLIGIDVLRYRHRGHFVDNSVALAGITGGSAKVVFIDS